MESAEITWKSQDVIKAGFMVKFPIVLPLASNPPKIGASHSISDKEQAVVSARVSVRNQAANRRFYM